MDATATLFLDDGNIEATNNRRERELRRLVLGRKNWLFTWLDEGAERTGNILSIVATCIAHDVNPRAYLHKVVYGIVHGWPHNKLRELLPDRVLTAHPELYVGDPDALPMPVAPRALERSAAVATASHLQRVCWAHAAENLPRAHRPLPTR